MVSAVGSSGHRPAAAVPSRPAGLDAALEKFKKQLSDTVNCDSAKTPEGKAKIEDLSAKISAVKARMRKEEDTAAKDGARDTPKAEAARRARAGASADPGTDAQGRDGAAAEGRRAPPLNGLGGFVDVYA